ncbi:putative N-acetylated-alpha-linked acidic dipeptidase [Apostichopus japonicus]|uniref:putative N-acetylated-alpha-linked acidic dipeptidase n=1 Tax=Stichopus japonicus TaxID=307972 RepID=UPI003AB5C20D
MGNERVFAGIGGIVLLAVGISIGVLIGWYSGPDRVNTSMENALSEEESEIQQRLLDLIDNTKIDENLRFLTSEPHVAGRPQQYVLAEWVRDKFTEYGFDSSEIVTYNVLLSYPSEVDGEESVVQHLVYNDTEDGYQVEYESQTSEPALDETGKDKDVLPPFNAYSANGIVEGELVYANYARVEDFFALEDLGISVQDKIVIARYGKIYRGDKGKFAAQFGAKGLILFSDPADYTVLGQPVYPDGLYLPPTGSQRGSCLDGSGDPLTPGYPAVESAYRYPENGSTYLGLPTIPIHPIPSVNAKYFLSLMEGDEVIEEWRGGIEGLTYKYGPGFAAPSNESLVRMRISTSNQRTDAWNVIGTIRGSVEPDRYVILGNHRDAWAFGAIDPSSGTAAMMEVARAFGVLLKEGWRPRRTVMFGSWGAEEYGLIGSNEWVEEFSKNLDNRAVAYLNIDIAVSGTYTPDFGSTPNLYNTIRAATKLVPDPNPDEFENGAVTTVYDRWSLRDSGEDEPGIHDLGSGSDYAPFLQVVGVSAVDYTFVHDKATIPISPYPMYHSVYETYELVKNFYDPDFYYHQASSRLFAEMLRDLADSKIIPLNCAVYADRIGDFFTALKEGETGQKMVNDGDLSFDFMEDAVENLKVKADAFENYIANTLDKSDILAVREVNDRLMNFERSFIDPLGLPGRPTIRHVVFAPSSRDSYSSDKFAGIIDTMFDIDNNTDPEKWGKVEQQLAAVTYALASAAHSLELNMA